MHLKCKKLSIFTILPQKNKILIDTHAEEIFYPLYKS